MPHHPTIDINNYQCLVKQLINEHLSLASVQQRSAERHHQTFHCLFSQLHFIYFHFISLPQSSMPPVKTQCAALCSVASVQQVEHISICLSFLGKNLYTHIYIENLLQMFKVQYLLCKVCNHCCSFLQLI